MRGGSTLTTEAAQDGRVVLKPIDDMLPIGTAHSVTSLRSDIARLPIRVSSDGSSRSLQNPGRDPAEARASGGTTFLRWDFPPLWEVRAGSSASLYVPLNLTAGAFDTARIRRRLLPAGSMKLQPSGRA